MRLRDAVLSCALALTGACSSGPVALLPAPVDHDVQGSWGQDTHGAIVPGNSFVMALTESNGAITGVGSFAGEAAPYGSLRVTGTVRRDSVELQIVFVFEPTAFPTLRPVTAVFAGVLTSMNAIEGQLTEHGATQRLDLIRLTSGDPPIQRGHLTQWQRRHETSLPAQDLGTSSQHVGS